MKKAVTLAVLSFFIISCGKKENSGGDFSTSKEETTTTSKSSSDYDPNRGIGPYENMELPATLDHQLASAGENAAGIKCLSCHKLNSERLVGPGWEGVTKRRTPEWIMNFITNPDPMIDQDPELQAQLEICLIRMPNQNLSDDEARSILEFMRKNDGVQ